MSKIIIKANTNKQKGWYFPLCGSRISMTISFEDGWDYDSGDQQSDLHKVTGIALFHPIKSFATTKTKKWWELHKWLSIRVGARYNKEEQVMEVTDYTYIDGIGERDTTDNIIVKVKRKEKIGLDVYIKKNKLCLDITKQDGTKTCIEKDCKTPFLTIPFFLLMRAYVGSGFTTQTDMIINRY